jgi:hypothetical protein
MSLNYETKSRAGQGGGSGAHRGLRASDSELNTEPRSRGSPPSDRISVARRQHHMFDPWITHQFGR